MQPPLPRPAPNIDRDAVRKAATILGAAKRPMIVCGGGAQDAAAEVTALSAMLQAPVLAYRRGRGVLDGRSPFSVTLPLGHELWGEADAVLAVGTRLLMQFREWGVDRDLAIVRVDADPQEHNRWQRPRVALVGDAKPILQSLLAELPARNAKRASRQAEMDERQAFGARASMAFGRDLDAAIVLVERWWRDERKAFQIASALSCATRLSLEALGELRLILRLMRWKKLHGEFREIVAMLCAAPIAAAAE